MFQVKTKPNQTKQKQKGGKEILWSVEEKLPGMYRTIAEEPTDVISTQVGLFGWSCITCAASIFCTLKNT